MRIYSVQRAEKIQEGVALVVWRTGEEGGKLIR